MKPYGLRQPNVSSEHMSTVEAQIRLAELSAYNTGV